MLSLNLGIKYRTVMAEQHAMLRGAVRALLQAYSSVVVIAGYLSADCVQAGAGSPSDVLTPREKQVLKLIAAGRRNREIAESLSLSVKTVERHRANLMTKLDLHSTAALTVFAIKDGTLSA